MRIVTSDLFSIRNLLSEIKGFNIQFKIIFSIITFACISYIFISIGNIYAQNQRYLSIIEDKDKNYAIVRQYNETIIAKEIKNNLIFNEENHIFKVNDLKDKKNQEIHSKLSWIAQCTLCVKTNLPDCGKPQPHSTAMAQNPFVT
ncbi:hypothetical protein I3679_007920 [Proteus mirabilis]|uniref:Uncharacterized protein n=1 Tax=Proteus mirabilis TaxID=584 RepID=A0ABD5LRX8_PROMI